MKGSFIFKNEYPYLTALLNILLTTYPAPLFPGICPSQIQKATALIWSEITLIAISAFKLDPYFLLESDSIVCINGEKISVS